MSLGYLLASLPALAYGREPGITAEAFAEACASALGARDAAAAALLAFGGEAPSDHPAVRRWRGLCAAIDAAIEKVQATLDPEENVAAITELNKLVNENCPQVPLYLKNNTRAYKSDLQGFNVNAGGTTYYEQFSWGN